MQTEICGQFGLELPIFAFSHCRDVVAEVSKAGGMGVLGALAFSPEQLEIELDWIDDHVDGKPYGVDVVIPATYEGAGDLDPDTMQEKLQEMIPDEHREFIEAVLDEFDVPPLPADDESADRLLGWTHEGARPQVEIALAHPISLLVNALGPPPKDVVDQAHDHDVKVAALVGSVAQAERQVNQGVDIIVAQGHEAGGHTGEVSSLVLWPEVVEAVSPSPVLAAGGIGSGKQAAAALALGCQGVWTGSIWLTTAESDMSPMMVKKLLGASSRDTVRSRAMTGKPARLLRSKWLDAWERDDSPGYLPMPLQYMATSEAMTRINRVNHEELAWIPVGQIVGAMDTVRPARDVVFDLASEFIETTEYLTGLLNPGS